MMSANPHSGIDEAQVAKTLDTTVPPPQKAQGGQMIVERAASPNGGDTCWSIGNGQVQGAMSSLKECCQTLNCMHETQKIAIVREAAHHHAVAVVRKDEENEEELPFDCALCGHRGETREGEASGKMPGYTPIQGVWKQLLCQLR